MRIGVISDIHANYDALSAVMRVLDQEGYDYLACLGDVVGYGAQPNKCCDLLRKKADVTVLGNHDAAVCGRMDYSYYRAAARQALDWHSERLSADNMLWLQTLPYISRLGDLAFCHGSPLALEDFEYIFVLDQMRNVVEAHEDQAAVTFIGHSHLCKCFVYDGTKADEVLRTRFPLDAGRKYIITAGSVGQPRDYDPRACACIYDTEARRFEYFRVPYDVEAAARRIFEADLSAAFGKRLFLGV